MNHQTETVLNVAGMTCPSCIRHVEQALGGVEGVSHVEVRLSEGQVLVRHERQDALVASLVRALEAAGYEAAAART